MKIAVFPGSFAPFTIGHYDIVRRGLLLFDRIIIGIGKNVGKDGLESVSSRVSSISSAFAGDSRVSVEAYDGMTVDWALSCGANFILRGARNSADFLYEQQLAQVNRELSGIETVVLFSRPQYCHISSSLVRELSFFKKDIDKYLPPKI